MVATAEKNIIANAAQKEENLNVQILVDKQTKDLKVGLSCIISAQTSAHAIWMIRSGDRIFMFIKNQPDINYSFKTSDIFSFPVISIWYFFV